MCSFKKADLKAHPVIKPSCSFKQEESKSHPVINTSCFPSRLHRQAHKVPTNPLDTHIGQNASTLSNFEQKQAHTHNGAKGVNPASLAFQAGCEKHKKAIFVVWYFALRVSPILLVPLEWRDIE